MEQKSHLVGGKSLEINILFVIVVAVLAVGTLWGWQRGLLEGIIRIVSGILGVIVLVIVAKGAGNFMQGSYGGVVMALILLAAIRMIYRIVRLVTDSLKLVRALPVGRLADKIAGAALGLVESVAVIWLAFILIGSFDWFHLNTWIQEQVAESKLLTLLYFSNYIVVLLK